MVLIEGSEILKQDLWGTKGTMKDERQKGIKGMNVSFKLLLLIALYAALYWTTFSVHVMEMLSNMF